MNRHLNIYQTYTKLNRDNNQLENDLTRALAIVLQENEVFLHEFLTHIFKNEKYIYNNLFDDYNGKNSIEIDIQKQVNSIENCDYIFAVRISEFNVSENFYENRNKVDHNAITDLFIQIDNVAIIIEVKPNAYNSTNQLYTQALNALSSVEEVNSVEEIEEEIIKDKIKFVDLNWPLLMEFAVQVNNYQIAVQNPSRILSDFIAFIKKHNYSWLPQLSLSSLSFSDSQQHINKRFSDAIDASGNEAVNGRLGLIHNFRWARELIVSFNVSNNEVIFTVYPGNTKGQGRPLFEKEGEPNFKERLLIKGQERKLHKTYHIKFFSQRYITGLWASAEDFVKPLYTQHNFHHYTGRKYRGNDWHSIEQLFNESFKKTYNWKEQCEWTDKIIETNRARFDLSFGYEMSIAIPYSELQNIDTDKNNLQPLIDFINEVRDAFETIIE